MRKKRDLSWLGSLSLSTGKYPSLTAMEFLMEKLGHPERQTKFVHIAGTNGKGSVAEMMARILEKAGYRTGKFMSPHLIRFNERIQVDGQEITDMEIEQILDELAPAIDEYEAEFGVDITLFEIETTMALVYYARKKCDIVVLEVGLGGKYDCTNIVTPELAIIVSIGYDHMNVLGESLTEIATQKAGIIKPGGILVTGDLPKEARKVIEQKSEERGASWREVKAAKAEINAEGVRIEDEEFGKIQVSLRGEKQAENAAICLESVRILRERGWKISDAAVREGLGSVVHRGRFEVVSEKPLVVFDGAHNLPAVENFWKNVEAYYGNDAGKQIFIVSLLKKKDSRKILQVLLREGVEAIFTTGNDPELYTPGEELRAIAQEIWPQGKYRALELDGALAEIKKLGQEKTAFVVGSFYIYGDVRRAFDGE